MLKVFFIFMSFNFSMAQDSPPDFDQMKINDIFTRGYMIQATVANPEGISFLNPRKEVEIGHCKLIMQQTNKNIILLNNRVIDFVNATGNGNLELWTQNGPDPKDSTVKKLELYGNLKDTLADLKDRCKSNYLTFSVVPTTLERQEATLGEQQATKTAL